MWPSNPFVTSDVSEAQNCGKMGVFDRTKPDYGGKTAVKLTTVKNCGKMGVFDRTEPDYGGKLW